MSHRYADRYDDWERDDYDRRPPPPRGGYEVDLEIDRERYERRPARAPSLVDERRRAPRQPDFLREDYGRDDAGPLVIRESERIKDYQREKGKTDISVIGSRRGGSPPDERVIKEKDIIFKEKFRENGSDSGRSRRGRPPREKEELIVDERREVRDGYRERGFRDVEKEEVIITKKDRDFSPPPRRKDIVENREILIRREDSRPPPKREFEREDIYIRDERSPPDDRMKEEVIYRERDSSGRRLGREFEEKVVIEDRERVHSRPPRLHSLGPPVAREREEFIFRRRRSPSPRRSPTPPPRDYERERIIIRRRESSPPPREPSPEPEPVPEPAPLREPSPEPIPLYRPPIVQHIYTHHHHIDHGLSRARSPSPPPRIPSPPPPKKRDESIEIEIRRRGVRGGQEFYEKDVIHERERDTGSRIKEEVKVTTKREETSRPLDNDPGRRDSGRAAKRAMWTEVTKDLVIKEAIEKAGYDYEETDDFFYVVEFLKYDDVVRLVEISEDIRREKRERVRDVGWEKEDEDRVSLTAGRPKERERIREYDHIREVREVRDTRDTRSVRSGRYR